MEDFLQDCLYEQLQYQKFDQESEESLRAAFSITNDKEQEVIVEDIDFDDISRVAMPILSKSV